MFSNVLNVSWKDETHIKNLNPVLNVGDCSTLLGKQSKQSYIYLFMKVAIQT